MTDIDSNFRRFGTHHTACGRVLKRSHTAALDDDAMDNPPPGIEPVHHVIQGARAYAQAKGLADPHEGIDYQSVRTHRGLLTDLAHHYDHLPLNDPSAHKHFAAMRDEVNSQYHFMTNRMGIKVHVVDHDPYKDVHELRNDVDKNRQIQVLGTHKTGAHPFFSNDENDRFRAVHDVFGHLGTGRNFDRHGEEAAFQAHSRMFTHHALPAMTSETRGQNGSLIVNGHFGPQRIAVLPQHLWHPGLANIKNATIENNEHHANWFGDVSTEYSEAASHLMKNPPGWRDSYNGTHNKEFIDGARSMINEAQRIHTPLYSGHVNPHKKFKEGDTFTIPLMAATKNYSWAKEYSMPNTEEDHIIYEFPKGAHGVEIHPDEHAITGKYLVHRAEPHRIVFHPIEHIKVESMITRVAIMKDTGEFRVLSHVSGNSINILHCPFCGSGAVIGRSDGTIECGYCTTVFTVQVQPAYNGFPQSVDGQPYPWPGAPDPGDVLAPQAPPGTNLAPGGPPPMGMEGPPDSSDPTDADGDFGDEEDNDDKPDFLKGKSDKKDDSDKDAKKKDGNPFGKKSYVARNGAELPVDEFLAHIAITTAKDPNQAVQKVREARNQGRL